MKQALLSILPPLCALIIALGAVVFSLGAGIGAHYHPQSPHAHLVFPYLVGSLLAAFFAFLLLVWHLFSSSSTWRQSLKHMLIGTGAFLIAGVLLPFVYRVPDEIILRFQGQTYAIPRVWNPRAARDGTSLSVQFCLDTLEPKYADLNCSRPGTTELTTLPILRATYAAFALREAKATDDGKRILTPGDLARTSETTFEGVTGGWRQIRFVVDTTGTVQEFRSCGKGKVYANAPCDVGVKVSLGTVLIHLPPDRSPSAEAMAFLKRLETWRCPKAPGCTQGR
jgi:hypothetical protein